MTIRILNRIPTFLLTIAGVILLFALTLMPADHTPDTPLFAGADKVVHLLMFGLLASATLWDFGRYSGHLTKSTYLLTAIALTLLGGLIELLQSAMDYGRSAEWTDIIADGIGAFLLPLLLWRWLHRLIAAYFCDVEYPCKANVDILSYIKTLYFKSFPEEERREWSNLSSMLLNVEAPVQLALIRHRNRPAGFLTLWDLGEIMYIEHFAIDISLRGRGIGGTAIRNITGRANKPVVLEVEPGSSGEAATRRIDFYRRNGFVDFADWPYIQPSYAPHLPEVEMILMATDSNINIPSVTGTLHAKVYGKK